MKNIVYIGTCNGIIGGIERYMQKSAELLRRSGFSVHYLYTGNGGKDQERFAASFDSIAAFSEENFRKTSGDLVIVHNIIPPESLKMLPEDRTLFFAHDHNIYCQRHHYYTPLGRINCHRKYNRSLCTLCSLGRNAAPPLAEYCKIPALVLSGFMAENLKKNGFQKVIKLPAFIQTEDSPRSFMPDGILRILFLGQLIRGKGADLMLKSLAELDIPFHCTIAGDGKDRTMLESMVEKFQLCDKVTFTGFVNEPEKLWQACDLFFFPIRWQEPFGLVGLEAMAHGVPVAAFDLGGVREYLSGDCGALIPEKDFVRAAEILKEFYLHPEILVKLGENGRKIVKNNFSEELFVEKFKNLPEEIK